MAHNMRVLLTDAALRDRRSARWKQLDPTLKALAVMASAVSIGCSWCVDFGYWETTNAGVDPVKLRDVPRWRDSDVYTDLERQVMAYAEAVTATPPAVTDEMVAGLRRELDDAAAGRADHDGRRGERPVPVQQLARPDQPGLQGPLRDPGGAGAT